MEQLDIDGARSASFRHMIDHLSGPLTAGAVQSPLALDNTGRVMTTWDTREPLVLISPLRSLLDEEWHIQPVLDPDGAATSLPGVHFASHTEQRAALPLYRPPVVPDTQRAGPFTIALALTVTVDGTPSAVAAHTICDYVAVDLVEGLMGRMLTILGAEKARIRRLARAIQAMRQLRYAEDDALDQMGADLGVPRFAEDLLYQKDGSGGDIVTATRREPDAEYRHRLAIYRPFLMPTHAHVLAMLNGPGDDTDPNAGLLGDIGLKERFRLLETDNEFAIAVHLIAVGDPQIRLNFLNYVRDAYLIFPANTAANNNRHARRFMPQVHKDAITALRKRLRGGYDFADPAMGVAPLLATSLDRLARVRDRLGHANRWPVLRAQDETGGSRYEMGFGVDVRVPDPGELDDLAAQVTAGAGAAEDDDISALLSSLTPQPSADDPEGAWLLEACGFRTVHRLDAARMYLSHLPTFGLTISGNNVTDVGTDVPLEARYHAPGDPGQNVILVEGIAQAAAQWTGAGQPAFDVLDDATAQAAWQQAVSLANSDNAALVFRAATLPVVNDADYVVERLQKLPGELVQTVRLSVQQSQAILNLDGSAIDDLHDLVTLFKNNRIVSVLPLVTSANRVLLVLGAIGLPQAGINLSLRRATGFRWYVVPIEGSGGDISTLGSRTTFSPWHIGLCAIVVLGYARRGLTDPYEVRVELPDDALLNLKQYEFLMNLLDHMHPIGVEVNTFSLRTEHVDLNADGAVDRLSPTVSKTYRQFRRARHRGSKSVSLDES